MHWRSEANFRQLFPGVRTDTRSVLADYGRIICTTSGAQTAYHLVLHLAERYGSRQLALTSAMKVRRKQVSEQYRDEIEQLYSD
ncbi:hypothetical protein E4656_18005 [Natronospirillum operosum]|uniref:Uncharacterized protein n=1 Tax=Natronospirillum operosum TaxID=2759953 RepID=A0A4Z0WBH0_9GAMM|nr:hypothetical protein [Natronospirillum operosum]TGG90619.1 hypothetical protein E4656_18005 [Natronospirillum operosum]